MTHFDKRCAQRNLNSKDIEFVRSYGSVYHRTGAIIYFLGKKSIPTSVRHDDHFLRLEGTTLIEFSDGTPITAYRNRKALKKIQSKPKHRY